MQALSDKGDETQEKRKIDILHKSQKTQKHNYIGHKYKGKST